MLLANSKVCLFVVLFLSGSRNGRVGGGGFP